MPIFRGNNQISKIFRGTTEIVKAFRGEDLIFQLGGDVYELIADVNVTTATTQIDFDNLNITKDDELRLVYTIVGNSTSTTFYRLRYNDVTSGYTRQTLQGESTSIVADRASDDFIAQARSTRKAVGFTDIKISNNDKYAIQTQFNFATGSESSNAVQVNRNSVNTNNVSSITKLSFIANNSGGIAVGSRLQLYKVNTGVA
jgi:hypothetical protein